MANSLKHNQPPLNLQEDHLTAWILKIYEPYKMQGYGKKMMQLLEKWLKSHSKTLVKTHAALTAEQFYRKLGYIPM